MRRPPVVLLLVAMSVGVLGAGEAERWKRPLSPAELWTSIDAVLGLTEVEIGAAPALPALPPTLTAAEARSAPALARWRAETDRIAAMVIDPAPKRPAMRRYRFASDGTRFAIAQVFGPDGAKAPAATVAGTPPLSDDGMALRLGGAAGAETQLAIAGLALPEVGFWRIGVRLTAGARAPASPGRHLPLLARLTIDGRVFAERPVPDRGVTWIEAQFHVATAGASPAIAIANASGDPAKDKELPPLLVSEIEIEGTIVRDDQVWPQRPHLRLLANEPLPKPDPKAKDAPKPQAEPPAPSESQALDRFLTRAFRRPPSAGERSRYAKVLADAGAKPSAWTAVVKAALADPAFLYLEDHSAVADGRPAALTPHEHLARFAYALEGRPPTLDEIAAPDAGRVVAMVRPGNEAFPARLADAWFELGRLDTLPVDRAQHPGWDAELVASMRTEVAIALRRSYADEGGKASLASLLDVNVVHADDRLARLYDLIPSEQDVFRPYPVAPTHGRCGLATAGALLALAAPGGDTAKRGAWMGQRLFGGLPAGEADELSGLLAAYDLTGRWAKRPTVDQPLKDVSALKAFLAKRGDALRAQVATAAAVAIAGYPLPKGETMAALKPDAGPAPKGKSDPPQAGDLRAIVRALAASQRMREKW